MTEQAAIQDPVVPVEKTYTYQPVDENSNPLGGLQVVKYDGTPEDLGKKMSSRTTSLSSSTGNSSAIFALVILLRKKSRRTRLALTSQNSSLRRSL